jgi:hypothetical protein
MTYNIANRCSTDKKAKDKLKSSVAVAWRRSRMTLSDKTVERFDDDVAFEADILLAIFGESFR